MLKNKHGQNTLEYALIISVVIAALLAVNTYVKKGVQGKLKESTDQIGKQFDPAKFTTAWTSKSDATKTETTEKRDKSTGEVTSDTVTAETVTKSEYEKWGSGAVQHYTSDSESEGSSDSGNAGGTEEVTPIIIDSIEE